MSNMRFEGSVKDGEIECAVSFQLDAQNAAMFLIFLLSLFQCLSSHFTFILLPKSFDIHLGVLGFWGFGVLVKRRNEEGLFVLLACAYSFSLACAED